MANTIQVVPYHCYTNSRTGKKASRFTAALGPEWKLTRSGWTWECVDYNGTMTQGLCRAPVQSLESAIDIAEGVAEATGLQVLAPNMPSN